MIHEPVQVRHREKLGISTRARVGVEYDSMRASSPNQGGISPCSGYLDPKFLLNGRPKLKVFERNF